MILKEENMVRPVDDDDDNDGDDGAVVALQFIRAVPTIAM